MRKLDSVGRSGLYLFLAAILVSITAYFVKEETFLIAFIVFFFVIVLDFSNSYFGGDKNRKRKYLESLLFAYMEGVLLFSMLFGSLPDFLFPIRGWIAIYVFGFLMANYVYSLSHEKGLVKAETKGILERMERFVIIEVGLVLAIFQPLYLSFVIVILAILTNLAALEKIYSSLTHSKSRFVVTTKIKR